MIHLNESFYGLRDTSSFFKIATQVQRILELQDVFVTIIALVASNKGPPKVMILINAQASNRIFTICL